MFSFCQGLGLWNICVQAFIDDGIIVKEVICKYCIIILLILATYNFNKAQASNFKIIFMVTIQIFITIRICTTNDLMSFNGIDVHVSMIKTHIDSIDSI